MRESLLHHFDDVWIDNLNGDKFRTGKRIPDWAPSGAGGADESIFTTARDPRGIQPGTAITTWLKRGGDNADQPARVHYRDFWSRADDKRQALLRSLGTLDAAEATSTTPPCSSSRPGSCPRSRTYPGPHIPAPARLMSDDPIDVERAAADILGLTRMNWNTASITNGQSVTLSFARKVGGDVRVAPAERGRAAFVVPLLHVSAPAGILRCRGSERGLSFDEVGPDLLTNAPMRGGRPRRGSLPRPDRLPPRSP